eukprot:TRINITY_DN1509_c0_g1_i2.p1 TRINITY_DN1509_c0_g1~~TRINITY_DN1509_c0_g1_i2.p1  ORF type:complete len:499 (-),score=56.72 TRINITY_DN1509_c0_g1_i2:32-1414(-)
MVCTKRVWKRREEDPKEDGNEEKEAISLGTSLSKNTEEHKMVWKAVSLVMLADVIGTGILTFNRVAAQLGWIPLFVCLIFFALLSVFSSILMSRTFVLLKDFGIEVRTMGDAAFHVLGGKSAYFVVTLLVYGYAFLGQASYLLVMAQNVQSIVYDYELNTLVAVCIAAAVLLPVLIFVKHISESTWLCLGNLILLVGVLGLGLGVIIVHDDENNGPVVTELVASSLTVSSFFQASTAVLYAYAGHWMYFELLSSMERPQDFYKVVSFNGPIQFILYATTAGIAYAYIGKDAGVDGIIKEMPDGVASRIANTLLFLHVAVVYVIKSVVLISYIQTNIFYPTSWIGRCVHWRIRQAALAVFFIVLGGILAILVPYFYIFVGLVSGFFAVPITYLFPFIFYLGARGRYSQQAPFQDLKQTPAWSFQALTYPEIIAFCFVWVLVLSASVAGIYGQILDLIELAH